MSKHLERLNNVFWDFRERDLHQYASVEEFMMWLLKNLKLK